MHLWRFEYFEDNYLHVLYVLADTETAAQYAAQEVEPMSPAFQDKGTWTDLGSIETTRVFDNLTIPV